MRGGHRRAVVEAAVGRDRSPGARVARGQDVVARGVDVHGAAVVGVAGPHPVRADGPDRDDVVAVARGVLDRRAAAVARGHGHRDVPEPGGVDGVLQRGRAPPAHGQGHVDHVGALARGGGPGHGVAGQPAHGVGHVGDVAEAARAQGPGVEQGGVGGDAHGAVAVPLGGDGAGHVRAVPDGVGGRGAGVALAGRGVGARVPRVRVPAVAVVAEGGRGDEVVAADGLGVQVGVVGEAGVDDPDGHALAGGGVPRLEGAQVGEGPQGRDVRVRGGRGDGAHVLRLPLVRARDPGGRDEPVGLGVGHGRVLGELLGQLLGLVGRDLAGQLDDGRTVAGGPDLGGVLGLRDVGLGGGVLDDLLRLGVGHGGAVLDDHPVGDLGRGLGADLLGGQGRGVLGGGGGRGRERSQHEGQGEGGQGGGEHGSLHGRTPGGWGDPGKGSHMQINANRSKTRSRLHHEV